MARSDRSGLAGATPSSQPAGRRAMTLVMLNREELFRARSADAGLRQLGFTFPASV